jgi:hypothetical protein
MRGDLLRVLQGATVLKVGGDTGGCLAAGVALDSVDLRIDLRDPRVRGSRACGLFH